MKIWVFAYLVLNLQFTQARAAESAPFKTKEPTQFQKVQDNQLLGIGKSSSFLGVLTRSEVSDPVSAQVDVYAFMKENSLRINQKLCNKISTDIFGPVDEISLKLEVSEVRSSESKGKICVMTFQDPDPKAMIKERHLLVLMLNLKTYALVFRFPKVPTTNDLKDIFSFTENLR